MRTALKMFVSGIVFAILCSYGNGMIQLIGWIVFALTAAASAILFIFNLQGTDHP